MSETAKKTDDAKTEKVEAAKVEKAPELGAASESSDGEVQRLLAERQTAFMNDDVAAADAYTAELAKLGVK